MENITKNTGLHSRKVRKISYVIRLAKQAHTGVAKNPRLQIGCKTGFCPCRILSRALPEMVLEVDIGLTVSHGEFASFCPDPAFVKQRYQLAVIACPDLSHL